jgi:hypothetical protein
MLNLSIHIVITHPKETYSLAFTAVHALEIESSWKKLTDTAKISFPRHIRLKNSMYDNINDVIVRGSKVEIDLGYNGQMKREFTGYVTGVDAKTPFTIECEDEMWKLKQTTFTHTWRKVNLQELVAFIYKGKAKVANVNIGSQRIVNSSAAKVLDDLKSLGFRSYFRYDEKAKENILYVGLGAYSFETSDKATYNFNKNVIENKLIYQVKDDMKLKVKATSAQDDNTKVEAEAGDSDGDLRAMPAPSNLTKTELTVFANAQLRLLKVDGYKGSITGFGIPFVKHGDIVTVEDNLFPERSGAHFADSIKVNVGMGGFRRNVELGYRAS